MARNFHLPGRSAIFANNEMAATSHPLATQVALDILSDGGNAVDAAVAACAVQCVVEPHMTGIGGDCFVLLAEPDGTLYGLNGSGRAPADISRSTLVAEGLDHVPSDSIHAVTAPGAVRAWESILQSHGRLSLAAVLAPSIRYAAEGFAVAPRVAADWSGLARKLARDETSRRLYLPEDKVPTVGQRLQFPELAATLQKIADQGADVFYTGHIAVDIANTVRAHGGFLSEEDLVAVEATPVTPIAGSYRDTTVVELPPNGQGIIALIILAILERFAIGDLDPDGPERAHLSLEAARLAYSARDRLLADTEAMTVAPKDLLAPEFIGSLAGQIDPESRMPAIDHAIVSPNSDTVNLSVVDREGRAVSFINSLYKGFGSGLCTPETGIMLQNRGACFTLEEGHPNCIAPGKRPMHTIIPAMALRNEKPWLCFGVMGGGYQPCGHAHVISNLVDFNMDLQAALDSPRLFFDESTHDLEIEQCVPDATVKGLRDRGHPVHVAASPFGGAQAIMFDRDNRILVGASDFRKDGCALGR